jgi:hypothetical protein
VLFFPNSPQRKLFVRFPVAYGIIMDLACDFLSGKKLAVGFWRVVGSSAVGCSAVAVVVVVAAAAA